jgi:hypothetical protein
MTVAEYIELVYLRVTGGQPSTDNSVMLTDIRAMLPAAANYAMDKAYNINLRDEGDRDVPSEFYGQYDDVPIDRTGKIPFIELVKGVVPLKIGAGIRFVYDDCGGQYSPLSDSDMSTINYYGKQMDGMKWFRRIGMNLNLYGLNPLAGVLNYQAVTRIEELEDTDEMPIQAGYEKDVLDILIQHFSGQRSMPYDNIIDTKDVNSAK